MTSHYSILAAALSLSFASSEALSQNRSSDLARVPATIVLSDSPGSNEAVVVTVSGPARRMEIRIDRREFSPKLLALAIRSARRLYKDNYDVTGPVRLTIAKGTYARDMSGDERQLIDDLVTRLRAAPAREERGRGTTQSVDAELKPGRTAQRGAN